MLFMKRKKCKEYIYIHAIYKLGYEKNDYTFRRSCCHHHHHHPPSNHQRHHYRHHQHQQCNGHAKEEQRLTGQSHRVHLLSSTATTTMTIDAAAANTKCHRTYHLFFLSCDTTMDGWTHLQEATLLCTFKNSDEFDQFQAVQLSQTYSLNGLFLA